MAYETVILLAGIAGLFGLLSIALAYVGAGVRSHAVAIEEEQAARREAAQGNRA